MDKRVKLLVQFIKEGVILGLAVFAFAVLFNNFHPNGYKLRGPNDNIIKLNTPLSYEKYKDAQVIFDSRGKTFYDKERIKGALLFPPSQYFERIYEYEEIINKAPYVMVYCSSETCNLADKLAAKIAQDYKSKSIFIIKSGIEGWKEAGYPTEGGR